LKGGSGQGEIVDQAIKKVKSHKDSKYSYPFLANDFQ